MGIRRLLNFLLSEKLANKTYATGFPHCPFFLDSAFCVKIEILLFYYPLSKLLFCAGIVHTYFYNFASVVFVGD